MNLINRLKEIIRSSRIYLFDFKNDILYTTLTREIEADQEMLLSFLVVASHTIEKGLTMPEKRFPFGEKKAIEILDGCKVYVDKGYCLTDSRFIDIIDIMKEYRDIIFEKSGKNSIIDNKLEYVLQKMPQLLNSSQYYSIKRNAYFSHFNSDFEQFSLSRRSCRNLPGKVDQDALKRALALSMNSPSTCNRQSQRVHLLQSANAKRFILSIQSGNRGFGDIADQFILISTDLRCWPSKHQRNAPYVDGGIYLMNLLYCLHHERIGACTLNLYLDAYLTKSLHKYLGVPEYEVPIALVAIGIPPETFDLTRSNRRNSDDIIIVH